MDAEAYRWQTFATVARLMDGAKPGAEASLTKLFWSELDVALHETALALLGPDAELEGPWNKGFPVRAGRPDLRRHQRDPAQRRRRARPRPAPMRFAFDAEQLEFRDAARNLLEKECPPSAVRAAWESDTGRVPGLWDRLVEMGLFELDELDGVLVLEETGRACAPEPVVEAWALGDAGATLALDHTPYALYADSVDRVLAQRGDRLVDASVGERRPAADGSRRLFDVRADGEPVDLELAVVQDRAALAAAAQLVGLAQQLIDTSVGYVAQREQFGKPVGSFQAVKHHLADAALRVEFARPCVHRAAWSLANGADGRSVHVSLAKAQASEAATVAARKALQVHGAIGYTVEYDLHMWMKRAWALAAAWGDVAWHRRRVKDAILKGGSNA